MKIDFLKVFKSFRFAFQGILELVKSENNAKFHFLASFLVVLLGFLFRINQIEWILVLISMGIVWSAEAFNTAIEKLCDFVSPEKQKAIGQVKDLAAAGVLISAIVALIIGIIIFLPKILNLLTHSTFHSL